MTLVSIAVCVRNGVDWIDGCMESLVNQTHSPLEIILVDDGSSDGGEQKVEAWSKHALVTVITQAALGLSAGRMAALEASRGEWFAITDIDVRPRGRLDTADVGILGFWGRRRSSCSYWKNNFRASRRCDFPN